MKGYSMHEEHRANLENTRRANLENTRRAKQSGADTRYKPPIMHTYRRKNKKKTGQPVALWMEHTSYWA